MLNSQDKEEPSAGTQAEPSGQKKGEPQYVLTGGPFAAIKAIAAASPIIGVIWPDCGIPPAGYFKGMALVYARVYWKFKKGNAAVLDMAKAKTGDATRDALAWYDSIFAAANMSNSVSGANTLRHLFVLLIGLGVRESSGRYCEGRDIDEKAANTASAGLFQTAYDIRSASPLMEDLFKEYSTCPPVF